MKRLLVVLAVVFAGAVPAAHAGGVHHSFVHVSGTYEVYDFGTGGCEPVGTSPELLRCTTTGLRSRYSGDLQGNATANFIQIINCRTGRTVGHGDETFAGSVDGGGEGTLTWRVFFAAAFDCTTFFPSNFRAFALIQSSSGALAGLGGVLFFGDVTYDGVLR